MLLACQISGKLIEPACCSPTRRKYKVTSLPSVLLNVWLRAAKAAAVSVSCCKHGCCSAVVQQLCCDDRFIIGYHLCSMHLTFLPLVCHHLVMLSGQVVPESCSVASTPGDTYGLLFAPYKQPAATLLQLTRMTPAANCFLYKVCTSCQPC